MPIDILLITYMHVTYSMLYLVFMISVKFKGVKPYSHDEKT